jgi:hypothetical protein
LIWIVHQADSPWLGLNFRPGAFLPNGFLLPANFANVLVGLPVNGLSDLENDFFPPNPPPGLALPPNPLDLPLSVNFRFGKSPVGLRPSPPAPSARAGRSDE